MSATVPELSVSSPQLFPDFLMGAQDSLGELSQYSEDEILSSLQYLVDEGFVEFEERDGEWFVKIAENV